MVKPALAFTSPSAHFSQHPARCIRPHLTPRLGHSLHRCWCAHKSSIPKLPCVLNSPLEIPRYLACFFFFNQHKLLFVFLLEESLVLFLPFMLQMINGMSLSLNKYSLSTESMSGTELGVKTSKVNPTRVRPPLSCQPSGVTCAMSPEYFHGRAGGKLPWEPF